MLNWIKFITVFLFALSSIIIVTVFLTANKPMASAKKSAIETAIQSGQIVTADYAQLYNGIHSGVTVFGADKDGEKKAVFIDEIKKDEFKEVKVSDGITADQAVKIVSDELKVYKILHATLGMEEVGAVWEVAFKSENGKLSYVYVVFEDGQWWKRILNL